MTGLIDFGYFGGVLPEADGGLGLDYLTWSVMMEEAGYCWLSLRILLNGLNIVSGIINAYGTEDQKERFVRPLLRNARKPFVSISEPDVGSNVAEVKTRADKRGDRYVLNGSKLSGHQRHVRGLRHCGGAHLQRDLQRRTVAVPGRARRDQVRRHAGGRHVHAQHRHGGLHL
ncbi:acyl-CoA dehydrogenase family protein [Cupriavidus basilensis]